MRATAEVDELAFAVQADLLVLRNRGDDFGLVLLAHRFEQFHGFIAAPDLARYLLVLLGELGHLLLDGNQVLGREGALVGEVVVEAVLDHRADRHLRLGIQLLDSVGQQVGRRVTDHINAVGILVRDDGESCIALDEEAGVDRLTIHLAREGSLGQA